MVPASGKWRQMQMLQLKKTVALQFSIAMKRDTIAMKGTCKDYSKADKRGCVGALFETAKDAASERSSRERQQQRICD